MNHKPKSLFKITKSFHKLPCAHAQFQDSNEDGSPGDCASLHGYDRSVEIQISTDDLDVYGWVFPFGNFKPIRRWLEYYFDHTSVFPSNDPRRVDINKAIDSGIIGTARILPYGVSMEMSALFLYENICNYVYEVSGGRCAVTSIEFREHDSNSGTLDIDFDKSIEVSQKRFPQLIMKPVWEPVMPMVALNRLGLS